MTELVARLLFPFALVIGAALWAKGYSSVGDGFSAGAIAGLGAIVQYVCTDHDRAGRAVGARWAWHLIALGLLLALGVAVGPVLLGAPPVTHVPGPGEPVARLGVLEVHTAPVFDLGVAMVVYGALVGTFDRLFPPWKGDEP